MKPLQASFTSGELSPLLHARTDLARYMTGAAKLENFLPLPQGGITRRPGFSEVLATGATKLNLVPFRFNSTDTALLGFDGTQYMRIIREGQEPVEVTMKMVGGMQGGLEGFWPTHYRNYLSSPDLRYTQSGNMIFFCHQRLTPSVLTRVSDAEWHFSILDVTDGPWRSGTGKKPGQSVTASLTGPTTCLIHFDGFSIDEIRSYFGNFGNEGSFGNQGIGTLIRLDFQLGGEIKGSVPAYTQNHISGMLPCRGTWEFITSGKNWGGTVRVQKSLNGPDGPWYTVSARTKAKTDDGANFNLSGSETEEDVLYRVQIDMLNNDGAALEGYEFLVVPYVKSLVYREAGSADGYVDDLKGNLLTDTHGVDYSTYLTGQQTALDWRFGAWTRRMRPHAVAFYQDRLVFAGSNAEPQTVWMSKIGDYKSFGTSDPIRDDDAITITLAGGDSDGIHSLVSMTDLLAFTGSGEWRIAGSGEQGALSPKAVTAHIQTRIGSKAIQPVVVGGSVVFVQSQGTEVHALGYNLQTDGYAGSCLSILSSHLFAWKKTENSYQANEIVGMAYQQIPDSILWFVLADGSMATCTYQVDHEVVAWARQTRASGKTLQLAALPSNTDQRGTDIYCMATGIDAEGSSGTYRVDRLGSRMEESSFSNRPAVLETLSVNFNSEDGTTLADKKLIPRVFIYALRSVRATVAPRSAPHKKKPIKWAWSPEMSVGEVMLDSGFEHGTALRIESVGDEPLTILAVVPMFTPGRA